MKTAVYAGTFDPITNGHLDIALRAAKVFDKVIIAVAHDNYKHTLFDLETRCDLVKVAAQEQPNIEVIPFKGLLVDFCQQQGATSIIRGLRAVSDFDKELQMALLNRELNGGIDSVFLMSDAKYLFISSSVIRSSAELGGDIQQFVPPNVAQALQEKFTK